MSHDEKVRALLKISGPASAVVGRISAARPSFSQLLGSAIRGKSVRGVRGTTQTYLRRLGRMGRSGYLGAMWKHYPVETAATGVGTGFAVSRLMGGGGPREVNVTKY